MSKSCKNISKLILTTCLVGSIGLSPVIAAESQVKLRGNIGETASGIELKGGVQIDSSQQVISLNLRDSDLRQVLRMLADKAKKNIILHDSVTGKVTVDLVNVTLNKAFEYIMTLNSLTYWNDGKTLVVASKSSAAQLSINKDFMKPIRVKYVEAGIVAEFLNNNIFSLNKPDTSSSPIVVTNPASNEVIVFGNANDVELAQKVVNYLDVKPRITTFTVNYSDPHELAKTICNVVFKSAAGSGDDENSSSDSSSSSSSGSSSSSSGSGSGESGSSSSSSSGESSSSSSDEDGFVCGNSTGIEASSGESGSSSSSGSEASSSASESGGSSSGGSSLGGSTLKSLNATPYWVMSDPKLGQITIYGGTPEQLAMAEDTVKKFDKKQPQVYVEISIIELSESGSKTLNSTFNYTGGRFNGSLNPTSPVFQYTYGGFNYNVMPDEPYNSFLPRNVTQTISMLIDQRKGRVLANPRIIASNNKQSVINISSDYVKTRKLETTASGNNTIITETYEIGETGINLSLLPRISPNGYVTLDLVPSYTSIKEPVTAVDQNNNTNLVATLLNKRDLNLSNIRVKDGETLILGGLIQETDQNANKKFPILGDIPVLGAFFKNSATDKTRSELILMITPRIIKENDTIIENVDKV